MEITSCCWLFHAELKNDSHNFRRTLNIFLKFRIAAGSLPYKPRNLGIKISHGCREIAFCPVGYFNLSHPVHDQEHNGHHCRDYSCVTSSRILVICHIAWFMYWLVRDVWWRVWAGRGCWCWVCVGMTTTNDVESVSCQARVLTLLAQYFHAGLWHVTLLSCCHGLLLPEWYCGTLRAC